MLNKIENRHFKKLDSQLEIEVVSSYKLKKISGQILAAPHRTNFYHIILFGKKPTSHYVDFEKIEIRPFTLLFVAKERVHSFDKSLNFDAKVIIFTEDFFSMSMPDGKFLKSTILFNNLYETIKIPLNKMGFNQFSSICNDIESEANETRFRPSPVYIRNLLHNFLILAERILHRQGFVEIKKSVELDYTILFRDLLETHFTAHKSVAEYASEICLSVKRLEQATVRVLGKSPKKMINDRVLLEAKRLLAHTYRSVKEIANDLGFDDPAYFIRYFKKQTSDTPIEFRERFH